MIAFDWVVLAIGILGGIYALVPRFPSAPKPPRCANGFCSNKADPRCGGGSCTMHCTSILGCYGACLRVWEKSGKALDVALSALEKARK